MLRKESAANVTLVYYLDAGHVIGEGQQPAECSSDRSAQVASTLVEPVGAVDRGEVVPREGRQSLGEVHL